MHPLCVSPVVITESRFLSLLLLCHSGCPLSVSAVQHQGGFCASLKRLREKECRGGKWRNGRQGLS